MSSITESLKELIFNGKVKRREIEPEWRNYVLIRKETGSSRIFHTISYTKDEAIWTMIKGWEQVEIEENKSNPDKLAEIKEEFNDPRNFELSMGQDISLGKVLAEVAEYINTKGGEKNNGKESN